jgi:hypothetical protein
MALLSERYDQLPLWPVFHGLEPDCHFATLLDAAKHEGQISLSYETFEYRAAGHCIPRLTVCDDIFAVPQRSQRDQWRKTPGCEVAKVQAIAEHGLQALSAALSKAIEPGRHYVVPHSAGYDSRILSLLLKCAKVPAENLTFVCWAPEVQDAQALITQVGWPRSSVVAFDGGEDFYAPILLDFASLGRQVSCDGRFMGGFHWLARHEWPEGFGMISALFADETLGWNAARGGRTVSHLVGSRMMDNPSPVVDRTRDWILPFASREWIDVLTTYDISAHHEQNRDKIKLYDYFSPGDTIKREMLRQIDPHMLDIPNPRFALAKYTRSGGVLNCTRLSGETCRAMIKNVEGSHLYDATASILRAIDPPSSVLSDVYAPWLQQYILAAMVGAMIDEGVEVTI